MHKLNFKFDLQIKHLITLDDVKILFETLQNLKIPMGLFTENITVMTWLKLEKVVLKKYFKFTEFGYKVIKRIIIIKEAIKEPKKDLDKVNYKNILGLVIFYYTHYIAKNWRFKQSE